MNDTSTTVQNKGSDFSASQLIAGGASFFNLATQKSQSQATEAGLLSQANELEGNLRVEKVSADAAANVLRTRLNQTLANNAAAFSTANMDPTSGSARVIQQQSVSEANRGFFEGDLNSRIRVSTLKRQAAQAREDAHAVRKAGRQQFMIGGATMIAKAASGGVL